MEENESNLYEIPEDSIVLNVDNNSEDFIQNHSSLLLNPELWHAFVIHNVENLKRNEILKIILNYVYPEALLPINFRSKGSDCLFLARNCNGAIMKLLNNKLVIHNPNDDSRIYNCEIILKFSTVSDLILPTGNISTVLEQLYEDSSKTLNLENFSDNKGLTEYVPLSQPKLLCFALRISDEMKPACIKLNNNEIRTLSPFEVLQGSSFVKILDLRNNLIGDMEELENLKVCHLTELLLDGNPLCEKYDAFSYVQTIKSILPTLEKLDGVSLGSSGLPIPQQHFLCNEEGFDLIEQFVNYFFTLYDSERESLRDLYHPSAMFSMTIEDSPIADENNRLHTYKVLSRNLLISSSSSHMAAIGKSEIMNTFLKLPKTRHNKQTFSVDLFYYSEHSAVLSIIGTFCEDLKPVVQPEIIFGFKRTFTLIKHASDCIISNELLHVYQTSEIQTRDIPGNHQVKAKPHTFSETEKNMAEEAMSRITGVNNLWIKRLLEDAHYSIIEFLRTFMTLLQKNQIPKEAYSRNNRYSLVEWIIPKMIEFGMRNFETSLQQEALDYIKRNPSFLTNINILSMNMSSNAELTDVDQQYCIQENGCQNLEMSTLSEYRDATHNSSEYPFHNPEASQIHIPHPKKNRNKRSIADIGNTSEIQNKKTKIGIIPVSKTNPLNSVMNINKDLIPKPQDNIRNRPNLILVQSNSANEIQDPKKTPDLQKGEDLNQITSRAAILTTSADNLSVSTKSTFPVGEGVIKKNNQKSHIEGEPEKNTKNELSKLLIDKFDIEIRPKLALIGGKWTSIEDNDEYDFQLEFNKWMLVQKSEKENWFSIQDDFQRNFTCWKKHFPTFSNETLQHSLQFSCMNSHFKTLFGTIGFPVTYWDFPATVPDDIRPPKSTFIEDGIEKFIIPSCGYGFVFMKRKWILVMRNNLNEWVMVNNKKSILWKGDQWVTEQLPMKKNVTNICDPQTKVKLNVELDKGTLRICDDQEQEIDAVDSDINEQWVQEEMKTLYADDTEPEETITASNYTLHLSQNLGEKLSIPPGKSGESHEGDMLIKWEKIFEFVPSIPKLALIKNKWTFVCKETNLKFHKTLQNKWVLLKKISGTNEWQIVKDDFCVFQNMKKKAVKKHNFQLFKNKFDDIPIPVTLYDFPSSVPTELLPPRRLKIEGDRRNKKIMHINSGSGYAFVSVDGQWITIRKNDQHKWVAFRDAYTSLVEKKIANMPAEHSNNETTIRVETEDDKKIASATCTLLQIITGTELVTPLTHSDMKGSEERRPPKLALTDVNGKHQWCYVSPGSGKGFVLEDGVWVKVVLSSGKWKATCFSAYEGCIVGYYLFNNIWVTMKKYILGGKWSPIFNIETTPTTYWNYIGPEELKPPRKIFVAGSEKNIHNNSNMGFLQKGDVWILMEKKDCDWKVVKEKLKLCSYKLSNGIWRLAGRNLTEKGQYESDKLEKKLSTYQNFSGLMKYAPPKQVNFLNKGKKIRQIIDQESGMGFILNKDVWVLMYLKNGNLIPVPNSKGQTDIGFKRIDDKFRIIRMDEHGQWINLEDRAKHKVEIQNRVISLDEKFKNTIPLTYDRILIDFPNYLKPPKYALIKDLVENKLYWRLVDENSGYGFVRENDAWLLMTWTFDKTWVKSSDQYRYKIINNCWVPMKNEYEKWVPIFDPLKTPKIPDLYIESPEKDLPNKIEIETPNSKMKINIIPSCGMGYMKYFNEYVLMTKLLSGKWVFFEQASNTALTLKMDSNGKWVRSTRNVNELDFKSDLSEFDSNKIDDNEEISTYDNTEGTDYTKPPQYIKIIQKGIRKWREIDSNSGFGFVKRKYWMLVKKTEEVWMIVNQYEGYNIMDNRWVPMKKHKDEWLPSFDPILTPRCSLDSVDDSVFPNRVITCKGRCSEYINIANDCSLGFIVDKYKVYILLKEQDGTWITMKDDFKEVPTMAFKLIDCKWQRMKKDTKMQWIQCEKQFNLPLLHIDIICNCHLQPPSEITVYDSKDEECKKSFNIFSNEGFTKEQGVWLLKHHTKKGWSRYPGIFGSYGYEIVNDKLIVMERIKRKWEVHHHVIIPLINPITYNETEGWPEVERPPMVFYMQHVPLLVKAHEPDCKYGFVKNKDVWVVVNKNNEIWEFERAVHRHVAYKMIGNRWVTMKITDTNDWIPTFNPSCTPYTHFDTAGKFEEKPPLRIILHVNDCKVWKTINTPTDIGFLKDNDMWVVMRNKNNIWSIYEYNDEQLSYKIIDGQWRRFTRAKQGVWKMCTKDILPVLACDFIPGNENAPPDSLCFVKNIKSSKPTDTEFSGKGFIIDNGAWVFMEKYQGKWKKFNYSRWLTSSIAYISMNNVWKTAIKDLDGSWKCGFINNNQWVYDNQPQIPIKGSCSIEEIRKLPLHKRPPEVFTIFIHSMPQVVSLTSVQQLIGFQYFNGAWVLLVFTNNSYWQIAGGVVAYKLIKNRWVTMKMLSDQWIPLYDPIITPITHFESADPLLDARPPLRIVLNENGKDGWKVIFQHSGYGFIKDDDIWVLMEKQCGGNWEKHRDYHLEYTGYRIVDKQWTRFKKGECSNWIRMDSSLPLLQCDFSVLHDQKPPPSFDRTFLIEPCDTQTNIYTFLNLYAKFGFRQENNVWILMECDCHGVWSEYKINLTETDLFGYIFSGKGWKLVRKNQNGQWVVGKLKQLTKYNWNFIQEEIKHVQQHQQITHNNVTVKSESKAKDGMKHEVKNKQKIGKQIAKDKIEAELGDENEQLVEIQNEQGNRRKNTETIPDKNGYKGNDPNEIAINDKKELQNNSGSTKELNHGNENRIEDKTEIEVDNGNKLISNQENNHKNKGTVEDQNKQEVIDENKLGVKTGNEKRMDDETEHEEDDELINDQEDNHKNKGIIEDQNKQEVIDKNNLEVKIENKKTTGDDDGQGFIYADKPEVDEQNEKTVEDRNEEDGDTKKDKNENKKEQEVENEKKQEINERSTITLEKQNEQTGEHKKRREVNSENKEIIEDENVQGDQASIENTQEVKNENEGAVGDKSGGVNDLIEYKQEDREFKETVEDKSVQIFVVQNGKTCKEKNYLHNREENEKEKRRKIDTGKCVSANNSWEISITNPMKYHEFAEFSAEEKPPRNICLKVRGVHRRISLVSKNSKIGFQHHNGVWVLLERLSGVWKIMHNSVGLPLAYKLIDNRWVSMRLDKNGSWMPTCNPVTTPRTYFDSEGPENTKPPRRVIFNESGILKWKEISEFSGFGFMKNKDLWILMRNHFNNKWIEYKNDNQELCAFKIQDFKWTKFTKGAEDDWKISAEDLPVLSCDFAINSDVAPPEYTPYLEKILGKKAEDVGFQWSNGAWILMQCHENYNWTSILDTCGFVRAKDDLWNVVKKDSYAHWTLVERNCSFHSIFEDLFSADVMREGKTVESLSKRIKIEYIDPISPLAATEGNHLNRESEEIKIKEETLSPKNHSTEKNTVPAKSVDSDCEQNDTLLFCNSTGFAQEMTNDKKVEPIQEELNSVEVYLAAKPDCCLGCPELQNLLRKYRPSNMPTKIIRKKFRLPDGSMRMLSIPKAQVDIQIPVETQEKIRKRRNDDERVLDSLENSNKKMKYDE